MAEQLSDVHRAPWWKSGDHPEPAIKIAQHAETGTGISSGEQAVAGNLPEEGAVPTYAEVFVHVVFALTSSEVVSLRVSSGIKIAELKELVAAASKTPPGHQQLLNIKGEKLEDATKLVDAGLVEDGCKVLLSRVPPADPVSQFESLCRLPPDEISHVEAAYLLESIADKEWNPNARLTWHGEAQQHLGVFEEDEKGNGEYKYLYTASDAESTLLTRAARLGQQGICTALLDDVRLDASGMTDTNGVTALMHAAYYCRCDTCSLLLTHDFFTEVNAVTSLGCFLHFALWSSQFRDNFSLPNFNLTDFLQSSRFSAVNAKDCFGQTLLHMAARFDLTSFSRDILQHPDFVEVNATCNGSPLFNASCRRSDTIFSHTDALSNATALHVAAAAGSAGVCQAILEDARFSTIGALASSERKAWYYVDCRPVNYGFHRIEDLHAIHCAVANSWQAGSAETFRVLEKDERVDVNAVAVRSDPDWTPLSENPLAPPGDKVTSKYTILHFAAHVSDDCNASSQDMVYLANTLHEILTSARFTQQHLCQDAADAFTLEPWSYRDVSGAFSVSRAFQEFMYQMLGLPIRELKDFERQYLPNDDSESASKLSAADDIVDDDATKSDESSANKLSAADDIVDDDATPSDESMLRKELRQQERLKAQTKEHQHKEHLQQKQAHAKHGRSNQQTQQTWRHGAHAKHGENVSNQEAQPVAPQRGREDTQVTHRDNVQGSRKLVHMAYSMELPPSEDEDEGK